MGYGFPFLLIVFGPQIEAWINLPENLMGLILLPIILIGISVGGALFGLAVAKTVGSHRRGRAALLGGLTLPLITIAGFMLAVQGERVQGITPAQLFALAFPLMSGGVILGVAAVIHWAVALDRPLWRAVPAAVVVWAVYLLTVWLLDLLLDWHVGGGNRAMVKVALVGNVVAATAGGALLIARLRPKQN